MRSEEQEANQQKLAASSVETTAASARRAVSAEGGPASPLSPDLPEDQQVLAEQIIAVLRQIYDPEIPLNIYDLGLIYALDIDPVNAVNIRMTLTAPGCPVADMIVRMVTKGVEAIEDVAKCDVDLVWEPPWSMSLLSEEAKLQLGLI